MAHLRIVGEAHDLLDEALAALIGRMRLACDDDLQRALWIGEHRLQPGAVAQHQGEPLVGRDPAGEPDREDVGIEDIVDPAEFGFAGAPLPPGVAQPRAGGDDQPLPQDTPHLPELGLRGTGDLAPALGAGELGGVGHDALGQVLRLLSDPGARVHAIGDGGDRHLRGVEARPQALEHPPTDRTVQAAHPVDALRQPHAHDGHVEHGGIAARVVLDPELQHAVQRQPLDRGFLREVPFDELAREPVDPG